MSWKKTKNFVYFFSECISSRLNFNSASCCSRWFHEIRRCVLILLLAHEWRCWCWWPVVVAAMKRRWVNEPSHFLGVCKRSIEWFWQGHRWQWRMKLLACINGFPIFSRLQFAFSRRCVVRQLLRVHLSWINLLDDHKPSARRLIAYFSNKL